MPASAQIDWKKLFRDATRAVKSAYAPYSGFCVGAVVLTTRGSYIGVNVENASYGLSICAERVAIFTAVAAERPKPLTIRAIAIDNSKRAPSPPCGSCRQVLAEFAPFVEVGFRAASGFEIVRLVDLLPYPFRL